MRLALLLLTLQACAYGSTSHVRAAPIATPASLMEGKIDGNGFTPDLIGLAHAGNRGFEMQLQCAGTSIGGRIDLDGADYLYDRLTGLAETRGKVEGPDLFGHFDYEVVIYGQAVSGTFDFDGI